MRNLFVNRLPGWLRTAGTRDGLAETFTVYREGDPVAGTIFLGRVTKVLAGIQAAFLDLGDAGSAFLNRRDLPPHIAPTQKAGLGSVLREGRLVPVQLKLPAYADKQAQVSASLSLAGFSCILIPHGGGIRFAKNFAGDRTTFRDKLLAAPPFSRDHGWLIRSAAAEMPFPQLIEEARGLQERFSDIETAARTGAPRVLYRVDPIMALLLDWPGPEWPAAIYLDDETVFQRISEALRDHPRLRVLLKRHTDPTPLFDLYKLESEFQKALGRTVWLKSGGRIAIHRTPAMTVVDVDSGKNVKSSGRISAAMRANLEAAREACRQIRLRNLAGIIAVDFINVRDSRWRCEIDEALRRSLANDPVRTKLLGVNELGLAHITRERRGPSLEEVLHHPCGLCGGGGSIENPAATAMRIQHQIMREAPGLSGESLFIRCAPGMVRYLEEHKNLLFEPLGAHYGVTISLKVCHTLRPDGFRLDLGEGPSVERPNKGNGDRGDQPQEHT